MPSSHRRLKESSFTPRLANRSIRRHRVSPTNQIIKPQGWDVLKRIYLDLQEKNVSTLAAGVAFFAMLSIFPGLAALISVYGLVANPATAQQLIGTIGAVVPAQAQNLIVGYLQSLAAASHSKLGFGLLFSVIVALWSARYAMSTTMTSLNQIYGEEERRGTVHFYLVSFAMTIGAIIFVAIILILVAVVPAALALVPTGGRAEIIGVIIRWPMVVILLILGLAAVYRFAPCRREVKWQWMSWGSIMATMLWIVASAAFSFYVGKFGRYDKTFGSLGAVVVLLTWLYLSAYAVFLGACLDAAGTAKVKRRPRGVR